MDQITREYLEFTSQGEGWKLDKRFSRDLEREAYIAYQRALNLIDIEYRGRKGMTDPELLEKVWEGRRKSKRTQKKAVT